LKVSWKNRNRSIDAQGAKSGDRFRAPVPFLRHKQKGKSKKAKGKKESQWNRKLYLIVIPEIFCLGA
jgi:hypothetical protein